MADDLDFTQENSPPKTILTKNDDYMFDEENTKTK